MNSPARHRRNPFHAMVVFAGVVFCLSSWLVFLGAVRTSAAQPPEALEVPRLLALIDRHGTVLLLVELGLLVASAVAAVAFDWRQNASNAGTARESPGRDTGHGLDAPSHDGDGDISDH